MKSGSKIPLALETELWHLIIANFNFYLKNYVQWKSTLKWQVFGMLLSLCVSVLCFNEEERVCVYSV